MDLKIYSFKTGLSFFSDQVFYRDQDEQIEQTRNTTKASLIIDNLKPNTNYIVAVRAVNEQGGGARSAADIVVTTESGE